MAKGYTFIPYSRVLPEQVLAYFKIAIDDTNKCVCPFHSDTQPSMQVNQDFVYCYGCGWSGNVWKLSEGLLNDTTIDIGVWLKTTDFSSPSGRIYKKEGYKGPVPNALVDYWHSALLERSQLHPILFEERLITLDTIRKFKLGYRPDKNAWVIPVYYGNKVDIVQFRSRDVNESGDKYWGLKGHMHGSIMNKSLLDVEQEYVVVLMGIFDPVLASQDGLPAVGINGSFPFKQEEKEAVQQMFAKQNIKFIVPDNNPAEVEQAHKLAEWIDGDVRCFPESLPHNTDYIDYRKAGKTVEDFKREVLGVLPYDDIKDNQVFPSLCSLYDVGNGFEFATVYLEMLAKGVSWSDAGITMANYHIEEPISRRQMYNVRNKEDFISAMGYKVKGAW